MEKALLLTIAVALVMVPIWAARDPSPLRGIKKTIVGIIAFDVFYLFLVRYVLPYVSST